MISGYVPESVKELPNLKYLDISNNQLIGNISNDICLLDSIEVKIDNNSLCPCYPKCIKAVSYTHLTLPTILLV